MQDTVHSLSFFQRTRNRKRAKRSTLLWGRGGEPTTFLGPQPLPCWVWLFSLTSSYLAILKVLSVDFGLMIDDLFALVYFEGF